jgi:hypothetical protein
VSQDRVSIIGLVAQHHGTIRQDGPGQEQLTVTIIIGENMFKTIMTVWGVVILVGGIAAAGTFSSKPVPSAPVETQLVPDPARDRRLAKVEEIIKRVQKLSEREIEQCRRVWVARSGCEDKIRSDTLRIFAGVYEAVDDEVLFPKALAFLDRYETEKLTLLWKQETTRLPGE